jgi:hypothetical protein
VRSPAGVVLGVLGLVLWALAAWVFLPAFQILPEVRWSEVVQFSPRWSDLLRADLYGGGVWSRLYDRYYADLPQPGEVEMGFTPVLALSVIAATLFALRRLFAVDGRTGRDARDRTSAAGQEAVRRTYVHVVCCALTIVALLLLFIVDERGNALFEFVWTNVPVMESIRAPFRIQMLLYPLAIYAVLRTVEAVASTGRFARRPALAVGLVSLVLGGLLMVEMYRPPNSQWTRDQLLPAPLDALLDDIEDADCDVLVVDGPAESVMESTQIDGTLLSVLTEKPTVHGYGRAAPTEHPGWDARAPELVDWLRDEGVDGPVCVVSAGRLEIDR